MAISPLISFHLSNARRAVLSGEPIWSELLPADRQGGRREHHPPVTYGDYFSAARRFLEEDRFRLLKAAMDHDLDPPRVRDDLRSVRICLEKHGEFYHPARIEARVGDQRLEFVLNVAVGEPGLSLIVSEYGLLERMNRIYPEGFLPRVYGSGRVVSEGGGPVSLFLGEWFPGFCEFHLSHDPAGGGQRMRVWDPLKGPFFLTEDETGRLYRETARILTFYYDAETVSQIYPWHHAAGDFVVRVSGDNLQLRLITARNYPAVYPDGSPDIETCLEALLVFFLNLTVRTRLDRLDGTGAVAWAGRAAVGETLRGVLEALSLKPELPWAPVPISELFRIYLCGLSGPDLVELLDAIADGYAARPDEYRVIKARLADHGAVLMEEIDRLAKRGPATNSHTR
jgi:hypothetical protein